MRHVLRQGKDGLALKAARGEAVAADLARQCPLLTPQQLYRLTEHYDNDWAVGARSALTMLRSCDHAPPQVACMAARAPCRCRVWVLSF